VKNPNIPAVRFIGLVSRGYFINETSTRNYFITSLLDKNNDKVKEVFDKWHSYLLHEKIGSRRL